MAKLEAQVQERSTELVQSEDALQRERVRVEELETSSAEAREDAAGYKAAFLAMHENEKVKGVVCVLICCR